MSDKKQVVHTVIDADAGISYKIVSGCSLTDTGNAERFITGFSDMVRYCADRKQWFMWNGKRWEPDTKGEVYELAKIAAIRIYEEIKYLDNYEEIANEFINNIIKFVFCCKRNYSVHYSSPFFILQFMNN